MYIYTVFANNSHHCSHEGPTFLQLNSMAKCRILVFVWSFGPELWAAWDNGRRGIS